MIEEDKTMASQRKKADNHQDQSSTGLSNVSGLPELKGQLYTYGTPGQAEKYMKTTTAIAEYVGTMISREMWTLVEKKKETAFDEPAIPTDEEAAESRAVMEKYKMLLKISIDDGKQYKRDKAKVFRIIMGQCTTAMKNKVESAATFSALEENDDVVGLLAKLKELAYTTDNVQYEYWTMQAVMRRFIEMRQEPKESLNEFAKRFLSQLDVTEDVWGRLIPMKMKGKPKDEQDRARNKYLACVFLAGVDRSRHGKAVEALNNDYLLGNISYPEDVPGMLTLLSNRRDGNSDSKYEEAQKDGALTMMSFVQKGKQVVCYCCGNKGHTSKNCTKNQQIPPSEWWIKKHAEQAIAHLQTGTETEDIDKVAWYD